MLTPESQSKNEIKAEHEFLDKLALLVIEYRTEVPLGPLMGALETVKLRLFIEASKACDKQKEGE